MSAARPARGVAVMTASALSAVIVGLCIAAVDPEVSTATVVFLRFALALVVLAPLFWRARSDIANSPHTRIHLVRGVAAALAVGLYFWTLQEMPLGGAMALQFTAPLMVPPLAALILGERTGTAGYLGVGLAVAGALTFAAPGASVSAGGVAGGLASAAIGALMAVHAKHLLKAGEDLVVMAFWFTLVGALAAGVFLVLTEAWTPPALPDVGRLALAGVLGTLAQVFVYGAFRDLSPAMFASLKLLPVPAGVLTGVVLLGDPLTPLGLSAVAMILLGNLVASDIGGRHARAAEMRERRSRWRVGRDSARQGPGASGG